VKLVTRDQIRGPRLTDEDFFAALDLTRPGLEQVAAAVAAGDHTRARAELLAYYRARPNPTGRGERRAGPRNERPSLAALTSWNGFAHSLTVNWTGWGNIPKVKHRVRIRQQGVQQVHDGFLLDPRRAACSSNSCRRRCTSSAWMSPDPSPLRTKSHKEPPKKSSTNSVASLFAVCSRSLAAT
jgi:Heparinase II/III N-terminus